MPEVESVQGLPADYAMPSPKLERAIPSKVLRTKDRVLHPLNSADLESTESSEEVVSLSGINPTLFGLLVAYLLPGLAALLGLSLWSKDLGRLFGRSVNNDGNIGLFLMLLAAALMVGLLLNGVRWLIFESWLWGPMRLKAAEFKGLKDEGKVNAFKSVVDENYRYHQFFGSFSILLIFLGPRWLALHARSVALQGRALIISLILLEATTILAAVVAYVRSISRARQVLGG